MAGKHKKKNKRERAALFRKQSRRLFTDSIGFRLAFCPLCLSGFTSEALTRSDKHGKLLTIEHAPPRQASFSAARCLTDRDCNSQRRYEAMRPRGPSLDDDRDIGRAERNAHTVLDLKSAYLIAYATLGYSYITSSELDWVRAAILEHYSVDFSCALLGYEDSSRLPFLKSKHVYVVERPVRSVAVAMEQQGNQVHTVFLPRPGSPQTAAELLEALSSFDGRPGGFEFSESYAWPDPQELPFHWDRCEDPKHAHPRSTERWGMNFSETHRERLDLVHFGYLERHPAV